MGGFVSGAGEAAVTVRTYSEQDCRMATACRRTGIRWTYDIQYVNPADDPSRKSADK
jgi:hypothetical protein